MKDITKISRTTFFILSLYLLSIFNISYAEDDTSVTEDVLDELITINIGTRLRQKRVYSDLPVPVDVLDEEMISQTGATETGRVLQILAPSFNFSSSTISDGTDALRPATLRGLGPDQTLVLINGKRRHNSALIHVNTSVGRGTSGIDMNAIPTSAIKRIEILRDGAAAQYGSDAIAGVINIVLKDDAAQGQMRAKWGRTREGDGKTWLTSFNKGYSLSNQGFINLTLELRDRDATNRAGLDGTQQYDLLDDDSFDPREYIFNRKSFRIGDAETRQQALVLNAALPLSEKTELYSYLTYSGRENTSGGFYRTASDTSRNPTGSDYPDGFLPLINTDVDDVSFIFGSRTMLGSFWDLDTSVTLGRNTFDFYITNSHNASAVTAFGSSASEADAGGLTIDQITFNVDLAQETLWGGLGFGVEHRNEGYDIDAGEELSYEDYDGAGGGAGGIQVFPGFKPSNEVNKHRSANAAYADVEYIMTRRTRINTAVRYERYSDFGRTLNGKVASKFDVTPKLTFRGAVSTGFRAPSLQQQYFNNVSTQFINNEAQERGTYRNDSQLARDLGIPELTEETSANYSIGAVFSPGSNITVTVDLYRINIDDRIILSGAVEQGLDDALDAVLVENGASAAQFFINAIDTKTEGVDLVVTYNMDFARWGRADFSLAGTHNNTWVSRVKSPDELSSVESIQDVLFTDQDESIIEEWQPENRINLTMNHVYQRFLTTLSFNRYGQYTVLDGGERQNYSAKTLTDLQFTYGFPNGINISIGGNNIFDIRPDGNTVGQARSGTLVDDEGNIIVDSEGVFTYSRRSAPFGFNGAFYYASLTYDF